MRSKKLSPKKATTEKKLLSLQRDNLNLKGGGFILLSPTYVAIWGKGNEPGYARVTRTAFNAIIDWYNKEQSIE